MNLPIIHPRTVRRVLVAALAALLLAGALLASAAPARAAGGGVVANFIGCPKGFNPKTATNQQLYASCSTTVSNVTFRLKNPNIGFQAVAYTDATFGSVHFYEVRDSNTYLGNDFTNFYQLQMVRPSGYGEAVVVCHDAGPAYTSANSRYAAYGDPYCPHAQIWVNAGNTIWCDWFAARL